MCVILVKRNKQEIGTLDMLKQMYEANTHGVGVAATNGKKLMTWKCMPKDWEAARLFLMSLPAWIYAPGAVSAFHFRIATSGTVDKACCHPFVVTDKIEDTVCKDGIQKLPVIMHNGVLDRYITQKEKNKYFKEFNDTQVFTAKVVAPLVDTLGVTKAADILHRMVEGSRLLIVSNLNVMMMGDWEEHEGFTVSNTNFLPTKWVHTYGVCDVCSSKQSKWRNDIYVELCDKCYATYGIAYDPKYKGDEDYDKGYVHGRHGKYNY